MKMVKDKGKPTKVSEYAKNFNNNLRATRRSEINGKSIDKKQLTQSDTWDLIATYFKSNNDKYKELLKMEYVKNG